MEVPKSELDLSSQATAFSTVKKKLTGTGDVIEACSLLRVKCDKGEGAACHRVFFGSTEGQVLFGLQSKYDEG